MRREGLRLTSSRHPPLKSVTTPEKIAPSAYGVHAMADDKGKSWIEDQDRASKQHDEQFAKWRPRLEAELTEEQRKHYEERKANNAELLSNLRSDIQYEEKTRKQDIL